VQCKYWPVWLSFLCTSDLVSVHLYVWKGKSMDYFLFYDHLDCRFSSVWVGQEFVPIDFPCGHIVTMPYIWVSFGSVDTLFSRSLLEVLLMKFSSYWRQWKPIAAPSNCDITHHGLGSKSAVSKDVYVPLLHTIWGLFVCLEDPPGCGQPSSTVTFVKSLHVFNAKQRTTNSKQKKEAHDTKNRIFSIPSKWRRKYMDRQKKHFETWITENKNKTKMEDIPKSKIAQQSWNEDRIQWRTAEIIHKEDNRSPGKLKSRY